MNPRNQFSREVWDLWVCLGTCRWQAQTQVRTWAIWRQTVLASAQATTYGCPRMAARKRPVMQLHTIIQALLYAHRSQDFRAICVQGRTGP